MIQDQVFRYYEPERKRSASIIPKFVPNKVPLYLCTTVCTNKKIKIESTGEESFQAVVDKNGPATTSEKGYVFIYHDRYKSNLIGACKIEINAMSMIEF